MKNFQLLNKLEIELLGRLIKNTPELKEHIPLLQVINREYTGVGMYVNFSYTQVPKNLLKDAKFALSDSSLIKTPSLKEDFLQWELCIENGIILFLEIVTPCDFWDGNLDVYEIEDY